MCNKYIGAETERMIKDMYNLDESDIGFDACYEGCQVEIKGCKAVHQNGVNSNGKSRVTKGRFWINNRNHQLLLKEEGIYAFVLYNPTKDAPVNLNIRWVPAFILTPMIGKGDNTKIRYDRIIEDYNPEAI